MALPETNNSKKTIALVANSTWNIYNFRLNLVRTFLREGYQVFVIAPVDEYIHYLNKVPGIRHIPLRCLSRNSTNPWNDLRLFFELKRIYKRIQPDLIIHYTVKPNIYGNLAAKWLGIKSACVVTGLGYTFLREGWIKKITEAMYSFSFRFADKVVFENKDDQELFIDANIVETKKSLSVNGCGVNTEYFKPRPKNRYLQNKVFTFIGRLLYDKGVVEFVKAAKSIKEQYPEALFWVIGEIDEKNPSFISKPQLLEWVENQTIRYFGTIKDVRPFIQQSDGIVLPSYREGLPKVILEALAMGKAIITTNTAGCRETVEQNKNGFLVPVKDSRALILALETFCELPTIELEKMGAYSREKAVKDFDDEIVVGQYLEMMEEVGFVNLNYKNLELSSVSK